MLTIPGADARVLVGVTILLGVVGAAHAWPAGFLVHLHHRLAVIVNRHALEQSRLQLKAA